MDIYQLTSFLSRICQLTRRCSITRSTILTITAIFTFCQQSLFVSQNQCYNDDDQPCTTSCRAHNNSSIDTRITIAQFTLTGTITSITIPTITFLTPYNNPIPTDRPTSPPPSLPPISSLTQALSHQNTGHRIRHEPAVNPAGNQSNIEYVACWASAGVDTVLLKGQPWGHRTAVQNALLQGGRVGVLGVAFAMAGLGVEATAIEHTVAVEYAGLAVVVPVVAIAAQTDISSTGSKPNNPLPPCTVISTLAPHIAVQPDPIPHPQEPLHFHTPNNNTPSPRSTSIDINVQLINPIIQKICGLALIVGFGTVDVDGVRRGTRVRQFCQTGHAGCELLGHYVGGFYARVVDLLDHDLISPYLQPIVKNPFIIEPYFYKIPAILLDKVPHILLISIMVYPFGHQISHPHTAIVQVQVKINTISLIRPIACEIQDILFEGIHGVQHGGNVGGNGREGDGWG